jgi:1-deoxy-D-xylulose-5-phosphate reductoisomerase
LNDSESSSWHHAQHNISDHHTVSFGIHTVLKVESTLPYSFTSQTNTPIMRISLAVLTFCVSGSAAFVVPDVRSFITSTMTTGVSLNAAKIYSGSAGTGDGWIDPSAPVNSAASLRKTVALSLEGSAGFQKRLSLLGSTGSIGTQTLEIVDACPENFVIDALSAGTNVKLMAEQVMKYKPTVASMATAEAATELKKMLNDRGCKSMPDILWGDEGILAAATVASADTVVTGIVGAAGLKPTIEAIKCRKDIALANKETLISGGSVINPLVEEYGVNMVRPIFCLLSVCDLIQGM